MRTKVTAILLVAVFSAISASAWQASAEEKSQPYGDINKGTINLTGSFGNNALSPDQKQFFNPKTNTNGSTLGQVLQSNPNSISFGQPVQGSLTTGMIGSPNGRLQLGTPTTQTQTVTIGGGTLGAISTQPSQIQLQTFTLGCGGITATPATGTLTLGTVTLAATGTLNLGAVPTVRQVLDDDAAGREKAIQALRDAGPSGLQSLLETYSGLIEQFTKSGPAKAANPAAKIGNPPVADAKEIVAQDEATKWSRVKAALDGVGGQKDNHTAKLYWYTDLEKAKAAAKESGKPILSLRLLGKLTDELSCANSRFFRTTLYPHAEINKVLRENFILHWETVRNVPIVTIDFGDGRKIVRTLTGNSIHYVLDAEGRPIEAIPGLYGPPAFLRQLNAAKELNEKLAKADANDRDKVLRESHAELAKKIDSDRHADEEKITSARTKRLRIRGNTAVIDQDPLNGESRPAVSFEEFAALHRADAQLDAAGFAAVKEKAPNAVVAGRLAMSKSEVETPWMKMVRNLQNATGLDTVKNEYTLHRQIHEWFAQGQVPADLHALNDRVYAKLFLMPATDPWLGLSTPDQFSAITNGGLVETQTAAVEKK